MKNKLCKSDISIERDRFFTLLRENNMFIEKKKSAPKTTNLGIASQYCCHSYVDKLIDRDLPVSVIEINHCYDNAIAERVSGILKQEYELNSTFKTKKQEETAFCQALNLYNTRKPHMSLKYHNLAKVYEKMP